MHPLRIQALGSPNHFTPPARVDLFKSFASRNNSIEAGHLCRREVGNFQALALVLSTEPNANDNDPGTTR